MKIKSALNVLTPDSVVFGISNLAPKLLSVPFGDWIQQGNMETLGPFEINTLHGQKPPKQGTWIVSSYFSTPKYGQTWI